MRASNELPRQLGRKNGRGTIRNMIVSLSTVALLGGVSAANASQPQSEAFGPFPVEGEVFYDCGDFKVLNDYTFWYVHTDYFDNDGHVVRQRERLEFTDSIYYRSDRKGPVLMGAVEQTNETVNFIKDENLLIVRDHGYMLKPPHGGVIFLYAGLQIIDLVAGEVVSEKGRFDDEEDAANRVCPAFGVQ
jgi:hypothetical protein